MRLLVALSDSFRAFQLQGGGGGLAQILAKVLSDNAFTQ
jgi:hypothetical protein